MRVLKVLVVSASCFAYVACGGGGGNTASTESGTNTELLQTTETAVNEGVMVGRQNASYAVLGDVYTTKLDVVPVDRRNSIESVAVINLNSQGAVPLLDGEGNLTWTPNEADYAGASDLSVTVTPKVGGAITEKLNIPVYKRRIALDVNVTGSGGSYGDDSRHYLIKVTPNQSGATLNGGVKVVEYVDPKERLMGRMIEEAGLNDTANVEIVSMPTLWSADATEQLSTQAQVYALSSMPSSGFLSRLKAGDTDVKYGSYLDNGANVFSSRKSHVYTFLGHQRGTNDRANLKMEAPRTRVFDYLSNCHDQTTGELTGCKSLAGKKAPVVLIHGFSPFDNAWSILPQGGGASTFGELPKILTSQGHPVFELQWHAYMRFEEAAGRLNLFTTAIAVELGYKPIVLAHSFGGIVATLTVQGQGVEHYGHSGWEVQPFKNQVAKLITLNSPLSGIHYKRKGSAFVADKRPHDGRALDFKMTQGRDPNELAIPICYSVTCLQAGSLGEANDKYFNLSLLEFNAALISGRSDVEVSMDSWGKIPPLTDKPWGRFRVWSGESIHKIQNSTIPSTVKVLRFAGFRNLYPKFSESGDGLISLVGQAAYPEHFVKKPYDDYSGFEYRFLDDREYELYNSFDPAQWVVNFDISELSSGPYSRIFYHSIESANYSRQFPRSPSFAHNLSDNPVYPYFAGRDKHNFLKISRMSTRKKVRDLLPGECVRWSEADSSHVFPYIICARSSHSDKSRVDDYLDFSINNVGNEEAFIRHPLRTLMNDTEWLAATPEPFVGDCNANVLPCAKPSSIYTAKTSLFSTPTVQGLATQSGAGVPAALMVTFTHKQTGAVKRDFSGSMSDANGNWRFDVAGALRNRFGEDAKLEDYRMWVSLVTLKYKPFHKTVEDLSPAGGDLGDFPLVPLGEESCPVGQVVGPEGACVPNGLIPSVAINFDPASQFMLGAQNMQAVTFIAGHKGRYAAKFGGVSNPGYIRIPNASTMQFTDGASFDFYARMDSMVGMDGWGRTVTNGAYAMTLLAKSHDQAGVAFLANSMTDGNTSTWNASFDPSMNGSCSHQPQVPVSLGTWVRITYTMSSTEGIRGYRDKQLVWQCPTARPNFSTMNTRDLYIGKFDDTWYPLNGAIQDIRIYKKALTSSEVASLN